MKFARGGSNGRGTILTLFNAGMLPIRVRLAWLVLMGCSGYNTPRAIAHDIEERIDGMTRRLSLLLAVFLLAACALPFTAQPTPEPLAPTITTAAPPEFLTQEPASPRTSTVTPAALRPTAAPLPTTVAIAAGDLDDPARIAAAVPAERGQVELAEEFKHLGAIPKVARTTPLDVKVGDLETFWVANVRDNTNYTVEAKLRYVGPVVLMYVDTSVDVDQTDIEKSAKEFEDKIYARDHELFGHELSPGIDGDPRLTILNTPVQGAGGYFSSADGVVKAVNRFSNEREMFVIGIDSYPLGTDSYESTLAHEFQHMIEWNVARRSPSWFNEGMSRLAEDLNGYVENGTAQQYLNQPDVQLNTWSSDASQTGEHYGTSQLFMRYFQEQYAGEKGLAELIADDAGNNLEAFAQIAARKRPDIKRFADLYADWATANVVNDPSVGDGRYAYKLLPGSAALTDVEPGQQHATVAQFGADYLGVLKGPLTIDFDGAEAIGLTGAEPKDGRYMWWSNRGDDSVETLTREFDLSGAQKATLQFSTWYEIEKDWDYGFVTVSTDGGQNWTTLKGKSTTDNDPQGQNFGNGLTGVSGSPGAEPDKGTRAKWIEEQMDLTPFVGKKILLRYWVVNDAGYNAEGMLIDNIRIPELSYRDSAEEGDGGWQAQGFVRTTGELPQDWTLRFIYTKDGKIAVEPVAVDAQGRATVTVPNGERAILAVMGSTEFTTEPASYGYSVSKP
jgi:immune inhibitor A